jgi:hypothetical protein|tara:strand:+ start:593 stop:889 length:297 start_codon:yes stop_codon:yes gene_type:complete
MIINVGSPQAISGLTIGNGLDANNVSVGDKKRKVTMLYHIALDVNYDFGFVETSQTIQTEVKGDMPWHEAVEQEINNLKSNLAGLDYNIELRWVKEYD